MTLDEVAETIALCGLPVTYYQWPEKQAPPLPYVCYYYPSMQPDTADDTHHAQIYSLNVELYTHEKDFSVESAIETVLLSMGLVFTKEETYLDDEHMYEVLFLTEVIING